MAAIDLKGILQAMMGERENKFGAGLGSLQQIAQMFQPGYVSGQERTALAGIEQNAVGRGLSNTTIPVAASAITKAGFEDIRKSRLSDALASIAGYIQGGTPTAGDVSHLATGGFSGLLAEKEFKASQGGGQSLISGNQMGLGYQPSTSNIGTPKARNFRLSSIGLSSNGMRR